MVGCKRYVNFVNISRVFFIVAIYCDLICWYIQRDYILELIGDISHVLKQNITVAQFQRNYDFFYPETDPKIVLVFVHIQKTGGTFIENALTRKGVFGFPCQCNSDSFACDCLRNHSIWLFSR